MVERPIKKSERQIKADANGVGENLADPNGVADELEQELKTEAQPRKNSPNKQDRDKTSRKGQRSRQKTEEPNRSNPALLRGPRPTKPKPPVVHTEEVSPAESSTDENVTSTES